MIIVGIDIGSRSIKSVVLKDGILEATTCIETTYEPKEQIRQLLSGLQYDCLVATGYGRYLVRDDFGAEVITEIKAHALGVSYFFPEVRTILDIGGQDTKAIALSPEGTVVRFEMNDRCAAGTGRFLEVMARALGVEIEGLADLALAASEAAPISSLCTVFAESEVIGLISRGQRREIIAKGIILSIAKRSMALLKRVGLQAPVVFTGGVALNKALVESLERLLNLSLWLPREPQITGALGAALSVWNTRAGLGSRCSPRAANPEEP